MTTLSLDFETRSAIDLRKVGVYRYASDPSTDLWCMAWAFDDDEPQLWTAGEPLPPAVEAHVRGRGTLRAWNAQFERVMWGQVGWKRYGFPAAVLEQWVCTAAEAAAMALPRNLADCAIALQVDAQKDMAGHRLMLQMCRPRTKDPLTWWDDLDRRFRLGEYCRQDVRTERAIGKLLRPLGSRERRIYLLDQRINDRGVRIDRPLVEAAQAASVAAIALENAKLSSAVGHEMLVTAVPALKAWLEAEGVDVDTLTKRDVAELLEEGDLPDHVRAALEARRDGALTSVKKLAKMLAVADPVDDTLRGLLLYHGASTGRWAAKLVQPHNFPRPTLSDTEITGAIRMVLAGVPVSLHTIASLLRACLVAPPGCDFVSGDFNAIEARVLNWCAGQTDVLQMFRRNEPVYKRMAAIIRDVPVETIGKPSPDYQLGKSTELGCGFGMGWKKFMATTGVDEELARRAVAAYRDSHAEVVGWWDDLDTAALDAVGCPGIVVPAGPVKFLVEGSYLWCGLPSKRALCYPFPKIAPRTTPWGAVREAVTFAGLNQYSRKWERLGLYGGLLAENVVQALARDLLADAAFRAEEQGYQIVLSVHDELVAAARQGEGSLDHFLGTMRSVPEWAAGCPVEVEGWREERYRK